MKNIKFVLVFLLTSSLLMSCASEDSLGASELELATPELTELDKWIRNSYGAPYNIEVIYKWNENAVDLNRYLHPPIIGGVQPALAAVKKIWIDSYTEVAGADFVKKIAPRQIQLIGGINLNPSGTITLGLAEGGKRITFFNTDFVDLKNKASLVRFVSTMQHEYCHILNQTIPFDEEAYQLITPTGYTAQWFNNSIQEANELGFITDYARASVVEDFAEIVNTMLSNSAADYKTLLDNIEKTIVDRAVATALGSLDAAATDETKAAVEAATRITATPKAEEATGFIRKKEAIVVEYFKSKFGIDFYQLQEVAARNIEEVLNN